MSYHLDRSTDESHRRLERKQRTLELRKQTNQMTDKILQAVFLQMFGDPTTNPMNWKIEELRNSLIDVIYRYQTFYNIEYFDHGGKVLKEVENLSKDGYIERELDSIKYIPKKN